MSEFDEVVVKIQEGDVITSEKMNKNSLENYKWFIKILFPRECSRDYEEVLPYIAEWVKDNFQIYSNVKIIISNGFDEVEFSFPEPMRKYKSVSVKSETQNKLK